MNLTVYTRHTYRVEDPRFLGRLRLACETSVPAMIQALRSGREPPRWVWWCEGAGEGDVREHVCRLGGWPEELFFPLRGDRCLERDAIQATLDSDDIFEPEWIQAVRELHVPGPTYLRTWQPVKLELRTGRVFQTRLRYSADTPSMFYAVYNPTRRVRVYRRTHTRMSELAPCELVEGGPRVYAVIHGSNFLMRIHPDEKELGT